MQVYVEASLESVEKRDPKGLYKKARAGEIKGGCPVLSRASAEVSRRLHWYLCAIRGSQEPGNPHQHRQHKCRRRSEADGTVSSGQEVYLDTGVPLSMSIDISRCRCLSRKFFERPPRTRSSVCVSGDYGKIVIGLSFIWHYASITCYILQSYDNPHCQCPSPSALSTNMFKCAFHPQ